MSCLPMSWRLLWECPCREGIWVQTDWFGEEKIMVGSRSNQPIISCEMIWGGPIWGVGDIYGSGRAPIVSGLSLGNGLLFGVHCWMLWKIRNERIFAGAAQNPLSVAHRSVSWSKQVVEAMDRTRASLGIGTSRRIEEVQRDPGPAG
ncbi:hypothetical protein LINPERHAP1_LOCUS8890 [Linum perenne]